MLHFPLGSGVQEAADVSGGVELCQEQLSFFIISWWKQSMMLLYDSLQDWNVVFNVYGATF